MSCGEAKGQGGIDRAMLVNRVVGPWVKSKRRSVGGGRVLRICESARL